MTLVTLSTEEHRALVHDLRDAAEKWLTAKGYDQFQGPRRSQAHPDIDSLFDRGRFYGWLLGGAVTAVVAFTDPDPDFWTQQERDEPQTYLGRFLVSEHGHRHGEQLLQAVVAYAESRGDHWVRLDCWKSNTDLHLYYRRRGFEQLPTVQAPGRLSGAKFQMPLGPIRHRPRHPDPK
jgi:GNAT superfamily N-acetyltransferase